MMQSSSKKHLSEYQKVLQDIPDLKHNDGSVAAQVNIF